MTNTIPVPAGETPPRGPLFWLGLLLVVAGMLNAMPGIPGLDEALRRLTGLQWLSLRKFPQEWFYPLVFALMMAIVVLKHSAFNAWRRRSRGWRLAGALFDAALLIVAAGVALAYLVEIESVCLIDRLTGTRADLIARSLADAADTAALFGLPPPTTVENPQCLATTGGWLVPLMGVSVLIFLAYTVRVWGWPLVLVALGVAGYTIATVLIWYVHGPDGINKYLVTKLGGEPRSLFDGRPRVHDVLVNGAGGIMGRFLDIIMNTVFPYLVLGALFGASAGGTALIRLATRATRRLAAGPAHAAIVSSALFGTVSGGPVVNVLSTGTLTIPMMMRRGFSGVFAGGMEAAASSGGSIMPPVMGVAAFVMAALTGVPYSKIIVAAAIPALLYFLCLFLAAMFQARKLALEPAGEAAEEMRMGGQDLLNLSMILGPIGLILLLLLTRKEDVGCGLAALAFGGGPGHCLTGGLPWVLELYRNSAGDAGSAGWWAVLLLMGLVFLDPAMRAHPARLLQALARAGVLIATLYLMFLSVSIIDFCLKFTGLPVYLSVDLLNWLKSLHLGAGAPLAFEFLALVVTMALALLLGMGMPAVPAYVNAALLMGPMLAGLGLSTFTAHMFIFYFAVASAITPPVALAAFAAASLTGQDAMRTGLAAVRIGAVMFLIPFVFAFHPELLLIRPAVLAPHSAGAAAFLPGYDGAPHLPALAWLLARLVLALYLTASALARHDRAALAWPEVLARLAAAVLMLGPGPAEQLPALLGAAAVLVLHHRRHRPR